MGGIASLLAQAAPAKSQAEIDAETDANIKRLQGLLPTPDPNATPVPQPTPTPVPPKAAAAAPEGNYFTNLITHLMEMFSPKTADLAKAPLKTGSLSPEEAEWNRIHLAPGGDGKPYPGASAQ